MKVFKEFEWLYSAKVQSDRTSGMKDRKVMQERFMTSGCRETEDKSQYEYGQHVYPWRSKSQ